MIDNINYQEHISQQGDLFNKIDNQFKKKFQSKSLDDLRINQQYQSNDDNHVSNTTRTEIDLSNIGCNINTDNNDNNYQSNDNNDLKSQRSRSAPVSPSNIYDKEFAVFIQCEQQQQEQLFTNNFVYNIDLSDTNETIHHQPHSRREILFDDDYAPDDISYERRTSSNLIHSSLINSCLTITEENEEELEQLRLDDNKHEEEEEDNELKKSNNLFKINDGSISTVILHDNDDRADILENDEQINSNKTQRIMINQDYDERLSTIYESPSPQPQIEGDEIYEDTYDKLIVYDIANVKPLIINSKPEPIVSSSSSYRSPILDQSRIRTCFTNASFQTCQKFPTISPSASHLCGTTTMINSKVFKPPLLINNNNNAKISLSPVSDIRNISINKSLASFPLEQEFRSKSSPMSLSVPMLLLPTINKQSTSILDDNKLMPKQQQHIQKMKVIQSSSSSLSDFIIPTPNSTLKSTTHYEEVPSVHHSLTDCSSIHRISCCPLLHNDDSSTTKHKSSDDNQRRPSFTRRILTNGLLLSHCSNSNPTHRRTQPPLTFNQYRHHLKPKSEEKLSSLSSPIISSSSSSSTSESNSPSGEKFISKSDFILQQQQNISQQRKATSLKTISISPKILYPIDFQTNNIDQSWYQKNSSHHKVPTSDSGIVIDTAGTRPTSNSSIEENDVDGISIDIINNTKLKQYENNYRTILTDLAIIKKNIVDIESRLSEAMRELEIERALVEGEHELVFKQILNASEIDQENLRHLYNNLQLLIERIMTEKNSIRNEIDYTQQILFKLEDELRQLEEQYRPSDDKIVKKKELIIQTRQKHEDLEFQLMELETRCETELEQAEEHFQNEQILVTQNSKVRQNTLRDLDHEQNIILHEVILEKDKLEREKQKLKYLFKQKKFEANELEQKINTLNHQYANIKGLDIRLNGIPPPLPTTTMYHSTPSNLYSSLTNQDKLKEMITVNKFEKMNIFEQKLREQYNGLIHSQDKHVRLEEDEEEEEKLNHNYFIECQVKLREKNRIQERPLTRYLPVRSLDFDLRSHIEGAGHLLNSSHINLTSTSCRGFLLKMGGMKFKTWNRRWFVFDRKRRSLFYYQDKTETKLRGCIYFQSIVEVYVDHLQSISLRSPEPRQATFIVKTLERSYYLVAPTVETMRIWVDVIITGAEGNTFAGES